MKDKLFDLKVNGGMKKDPLSINLKETTKSIVKGIVTLGIGIPILVGISKSIGAEE